MSKDLSAYFPEGFDRTKPVTVIAGQRDYPRIMIERMRAAGLPVYIVAFEGETLPELYSSFNDTEREMIKVGQLGHMLSALKKFKAGYAIMAGQVSPKKLFKGMQPDLKAITMLATLKEKNAESIFGAIAKEIEKLGIIQLDARVFMDEDLAEKGPMGGAKWKADDDHLAHGIRIAKSVAAEDIGQGVVVSKGTVLAVEAYEGTDAMLTRAADFPAKEKIFVKTVKPKQDYRFDVPAFGTKTLEVMAEAGIGYAALESGSVLLLNKAEVLKKAAKLKIALRGF